VRVSCDALAFISAAHLHLKVRYMHESIFQRSEGNIQPAVMLCLTLLKLALDRHIDEIADIVRDHYNIAEFGDPTSVSEVRSPVSAVHFPT